MFKTTHKLRWNENETGEHHETHITKQKETYLNKKSHEKNKVTCEKLDNNPPKPIKVYFVPFPYGNKGSYQKETKEIYIFFC